MGGQTGLSYHAPLSEAAKVRCTAPKACIPSVSLSLSLSLSLLSRSFVLEPHSIGTVRSVSSLCPPTNCQSLRACILLVAHGSRQHLRHPRSNPHHNHTASLPVAL